VRTRLERACGGRLAATLLIAAFLLGLGLRLDYAIRAPQHPVDDAQAYARISRALVEGDGYTQGPRHEYLQSASNYQPGLPLLVAGIYEVGDGVNEEAARIVLALLSSLAVPFAFFLGRRVSGLVGGDDRAGDAGSGTGAATAAGTIAALAVAVYPALLEYTGMLMTEPLGSAMIAGATLAFLRARERPDLPWRWALSGLALGAMAMLRPEYLLLFVLLPALALFLPWERVALARNATAARPDRRLLWKRAGLLLGCAVLVVLPWTVRNLVAFDRVVPISTGGGQVIYAGSYIKAGPDPEAVTEHLLAEHPWIRRQLGPAPGPIYRGQAEALLAEREHPGENTDTALTGMAIDNYTHAAAHEPGALIGFLAGKVWFGWAAAARGVMKPAPWRALQMALLFFGAVGLCVGLARRRFDVAAIAVVLLLETAVQAIFIASPRRTLTLLPLTAALAGAGAVWLVAAARALLERGRADEDGNAQSVL
jgi:4-amino-4-deoxy-L-arabinose transferase-like glycosyltransferase